MTSAVTCPHCQAVYKKIPSDWYGRRVRCKKCNGSFIAQPDAESTDFPSAAVCPGCYRKYDGISSKLIGKSVKCPVCGEKFSIGRPPSKGSPSDGNKADPEPAPSGVWEIGQTIEGIYRITDILGLGGMGAVHKVHHLGWGMLLAVKSPLARILEKRNGPENFKREAETWVNLPLHPHIVSCYYVRRILGMPRVFAEFVDGGSLSDRIKNGELYEGGPGESIARILDVAIQFAWGLDFSHEQGLIHQDVKPANVMLTNEGTVKVTDFGLARAQAMDPSESDDQGGTIMVDMAGMTPAYASPEQASGRTLTRRTDIWSWAASVLEMFTGEATWPIGAAAGLALEEYLTSGQAAEDDYPDEPPARPLMPDELAELLRECFREDPDERPRNLKTIAERLISLYEKTVSAPYPRIQPETGQDAPDHLNNKALSLFDLGRETEAVELLDRALEIEPHHVMAAYNRGLIKWRSGKISDIELVKELEEVCQSHDETWMDEYLLSLVHMERGDFESAAKVLRSIKGDGAANAKVVKALSLTQKIAFELRPQTLELEHPLLKKAFRASINEQGRLAIITVTPGNSMYKTQALIFNLEDGRLMTTLDAKEASKPLWGHAPDQINLTCLTDDGRFALTGIDHGDVILWDVASGGLLQKFPSPGKNPQGSQGYFNATAICADGAGQRVYIGYSDYTIKEWDMRTGDCLGEFVHTENPGDKDGVVFLDVNEKYGLLCASDKSGASAIWKLKTRSRRIKSGSGTFLKFSGDGRYLYRGLHSDKVRPQGAPPQTGLEIIDLDHNTIVVELPGLGAYGAMASPGLDYMLTGGTLTLWESETGRCLRTYAPTDNKTTNVFWFRWQNDQKPFTFLAANWTGDGNFTIKKLFFNNIKAHFRYVRAVGSEEALRRQAAYEKEMRQAREGLAGNNIYQAYQAVKSVRRIQGRGRDKAALDIKGELYKKLPVIGFMGAWDDGEIRPHERGNIIMSLSPDGRILATGSDRPDGAEGLRLWDARTLKEIKSIKKHNIGYKRLAFTPDGENIIALTTSPEKTQILIDVETGDIVTVYDKKVGGLAALSPDGGAFFAIGAAATITGNKINMVETSTGRLIGDFQIPGQFIANAVPTPDGCFLYADAASGEYRMIWNIGSGRERGDASFHPDEPMICYNLGFQTDKTALVKGKSDFLYIWNCANRKLSEPINVGRSFYLRRFTDERYALIVTGPSFSLLDIRTRSFLGTFNNPTGRIIDLAAGRNRRFAYTLDGGGLVRKWEFEWALEYRDPGDYDDSLDPYIINFLQRFKSNRVESSPRRSPAEKDYLDFMEELGGRGYGWLKPESVRRSIESFIGLGLAPEDYFLPDKGYPKYRVGILK